MIQTATSTTNNIIVIKGLEGNDPISLGFIQNILLPHIDTLELFWWFVWASVLMYMAYVYVVHPLRKCRK